METHLLEYRILSLLRNREAYLKYSNIIKEELFESAEVKYIYRLINYYHKNVKKKDIAPISSLYALLNSKKKENESAKYKQIITQVKKHPLSDLEIADKIVKDFAQRQLLKATILTAMDQIDKEDKLDLVKIRETLDQATLVESVEMFDSAYDYYTNPRKRLEEDLNEARTATGLHPDIDSALRRGLAAGEIGLLLGPTSVGKTIGLINLSYNAMRQGGKILYVTLELSGRKIAGRFDQLVARKTYDQIYEDPMCVYRATKKLAKNGSGLKIKDSTASKMSPHDLRLYLERLRKDFEFTMVVIDQIDLMYSPKEHKERRFELSSIIIELRRLGASFGIPIWSASQATRGAGAAGDTTLWDIAEDIGKANWADVVITISQSDEDKEDKLMHMAVAKNRIGEGNPRVVMKVNYALMKLKGIIDDGEENEV